MRAGGGRTASRPDRRAPAPTRKSGSPPAERAAAGARAGIEERMPSLTVTPSRNEAGNRAGLIPERGPDSLQFAFHALRPLGPLDDGGFQTVDGRLGLSLLRGKLILQPCQLRLGGFDLGFEVAHPLEALIEIALQNHDMGDPLLQLRAELCGPIVRSRQFRIQRFVAAQQFGVLADILLEPG